MRWMKHLTTAHNDERLAIIREQYGLEGYGFWWLLCELVAEQMDDTDKCFVSYPMRTWSAKFQVSKRKVSDFFRVLSENSLIFLEYDDSNCVGKIKISIPKLLKYRDEYSKKLRTNSGQTPDKLRSKIEIEKQSIDKEDKTLSSSLDEEQEKLDVYLTAKKRQLTGERLRTFNEFMDIFGDKRGRAAAADSWIDIKPLSRKVFEEIIKGAALYNENRPNLVSAGHTPKMAQGWLSGRRWEDDCPKNTKGGLTDDIKNKFLGRS